jgi:hypothetical protein
MDDWDAANPYKNLEYDQGYGDFQRYAQEKLGHNPVTGKINSAGNPDYQNYDMGLTEVRRPNNSMLTYVNPTEGYQDAQGNYYDLRGNPMAPPSWASEMPTNRNIRDLFGRSPPTPPVAQPVNRFAPPNAPGVRPGIPVQQARTLTPGMKQFTRPRTRR